MPDDPRNEPDASDFDDWLSAESAPPTDPTAPSSDGDDDTEGASIFKPPDDADEDVDTEPEDESVPAGEVETPDEIEPEPHETGEIEVVEIAEQTVEADVDEDPVGAFVEFEAFDGGAEADTGELEIVVDVDEDHGVVEYLDPFQDTTEGVFVGEMVAEEEAAIGAVSFGDLWGDDSTGETSSIPDADPTEAFSFKEGGGLHGTTREHAGLAEVIAAADTQDTEQVALVAEIPGLEPTVVG
ncbi:MAG: hypothetical protein DWP92_06175, partial [Armatimonadetes bacterium]